MFIQDFIHRIEEGSGSRYIRAVILPLAIIALILVYDFRGTRNFDTLEAIDNAQLARNIAEGKGYHTDFIRPFSVYLIERAYADKHGPAPLGDMTDRGQIRSPHPDISNPPVYPCFLAALMKICPPLRYQVAGTGTISLGSKSIKAWNNNGNFWIYEPDFLIDLVNQFLFVCAVVVVFFIARKLFDATVAYTAALLFFATDLFWRFSVSGLSTMLLLLIFLALAWCVICLEEKTRENKLTLAGSIIWALAIGASLGIGCLTRYAFGWLILPVLGFLILFLGQRRLVLCFATLGAFVIIVGPWVARNYSISHTPFGTAGYALYENIPPYFPEFRLERSLNPLLSRIGFHDLLNKVVDNIENILSDQLPHLGGSWIGAFFLVGLLLPFKNMTLNRLRYFLLLCLPVLIVAQAAGRTQLSVDSPEINTENILVILAPLVIIYGTSLFYILLDQLALPLPPLRYLVIGVFCAVLSLPALLTFGTILNPLLPRAVAVAYPPYYPPIIQKVSGWMQPDELMMSDVPWAVAWYGRRQTMWLTLTTYPDFYTIYDYSKPVKAVYLTPLTMDSHLISQIARDGDLGWGLFATGFFLKKELPPYFPLTQAPVGLPRDEIFLTDTVRWGAGDSSTSSFLTPPGTVEPVASTPGGPGPRPTNTPPAK